MILVAGATGQLGGFVTRRLPALRSHLVTWRIVRRSTPHAPASMWWSPLPLVSLAPGQLTTVDQFMLGMLNQAASSSGS